MKNKVLIAGLTCILLISGFGCSAKKSANESSKKPISNPIVSSNTTDKGSSTPTQFHPAQAAGQAVKVEELESQVNNIIDKKFPGDWSVDGTTLKKGSYVENDKYGITDEIAKNIKGSMVSIYVGDARISNTLQAHGGRLLKGYAVPDEVGKTMESGDATFLRTNLDSHTYQKAYIPVKDGSKTIAVIGLSIKTSK